MKFTLSMELCRGQAERMAYALRIVAAMNTSRCGYRTRPALAKSLLRMATEVEKQTKAARLKERRELRKTGAGK